MTKLSKNVAKCFQAMLSLYDDGVIEYVTCAKARNWKDLSNIQYYEDIDFSLTGCEDIITIFVFEDGYSIDKDLCALYDRGIGPDFTNVLDLIECIRQM